MGQMLLVGVKWASSLTQSNQHDRGHVVQGHGEYTKGRGPGPRRPFVAKPGAEARHGQEEAEERAAGIAQKDARPWQVEPQEPGYRTDEDEQRTGPWLHRRQRDKKESGRR